MKLRHLGAALVVLACTVSAADARPAKKHPRPDSQAASHCEFTNGGRVVCPAVANRISGLARVAARHVENHPVVGRAATGHHCRVETAAGPIVIACWLKDKMVGFIGDVVARGFKGRVKCFSLSKSHVPHSLHFVAEACDFAQRGWGKTVAVMYRVGDLARKWGLRDGCSFRDCGHIDSGRAGRPSRMAGL